MNSNINRKTKFIDLGLIEYQEALDYQTELFNQILAVKSENRNLPPEQQKKTDNFLIFCQHPNVFTLGRNGNAGNLKASEEELASINARYFPIHRGGDITYHGPGQLVIYPVIDLENFFTDIHLYMRKLEESVILTLQDFNIEAGRINGLTGVWIDFNDEKNAKKISALGVKSSRWVTLHGMAFNINTDLSYFNYIVPCGIADKGVTSLAALTGNTQDIASVSDLLKGHIAALFEMSLVESELTQMKKQ